MISRDRPLAPGGYVKALMRDADRVGLACDVDAADALAAKAARDLRRLRREAVVDLGEFNEHRDYLIAVLQEVRRLRAALEGTR